VAKLKEYVMEEEGTQKVDRQEPARSVDEKGKVDEERAPNDVAEEKKAVIPPPDQKAVPAVNESKCSLSLCLVREKTERGKWNFRLNICVVVCVGWRPVFFGFLGVACL